MTPDRTTIVFGPPGTGKTTRLLSEVAAYLTRGIIPQEVGFVSFTRKAAEEAKMRACSKFDLRKQELINFRTLHSMAFQMLGLKVSSIIGHKHYAEVADACGTSVTKRASRMNTEEGLWTGASKGDKIMFIENLSRISGTSLTEALEESEFDDISSLELELWAKTLKSYKNANTLYDFTDMVNDWLDHGTSPKLKVLFVDESQDLSKRQWDMVYKLASQDCDVWAAGDDDQAIFKWAGASPEHFVNLLGTRITLSQSYRIPQVVHTLALEIKSQIRDSVEKIYAPREEQGFLDFYGDLDQVDMSEGKWLILCRNNYFISQIEETCRRLGYWYDSLFDPPEACTLPILDYHRFIKGERLSIRELEDVLSMMGKVINIKREYTCEEFIKEFDITENKICGFFKECRPWFDAFQNMPVEKRAYYRSVLGRKENIRGTPRIRISTIHGAKGGEEENVVLLTDMSQKTHAKATLDWSDEHRVWYVGVTRCKKNLFIIRPKTDKCFPLLSL